MRALLVLSVLWSVGCASTINMSPDESCAVQGLAFQGTTTVQTRGVAHNWQTGQNATVVGTGMGLSCRRPANETESCEVKNLMSPARLKEDWNSQVKKKNMIIGTGYLLWVLPGMYGTYYYNNERAERVDQINKSYSQGHKCTKVEAPVSP